MAGKTKRNEDAFPHSKPGSVDQQVEDSFPASDAPTYSPGAIGAPVDRQSTQQDKHKASPGKRKKKSTA